MQNKSKKIRNVNRELDEKNGKIYFNSKTLFSNKIFRKEKVTGKVQHKASF